MIVIFFLTMDLLLSKWCKVLHRVLRYNFYVKLFEVLNFKNLDKMKDIKEIKGCKGCLEVLGKNWEKVINLLSWANSQLSFTSYCRTCFMIKGKRCISAIKLSSKIFTIILHWSIQLKEIQYNWKQVPYLYL